MTIYAILRVVRDFDRIPRIVLPPALAQPTLPAELKKSDRAEVPFGTDTMMVPGMRGAIERLLDAVVEDKDEADLVNDVVMLPKMILLEIFEDLAVGLDGSLADVSPCAFHAYIMH